MLDELGLRAKLTFSYDRMESEAFYPWLRPTEFVKGLSLRCKLNLLLPCPSVQASRMVLGEYWARFQQQFPSFSLFKKFGLNRCDLIVPVRIHGDEGRSDWACTLIRS